MSNAYPSLQPKSTISYVTDQNIPGLSIDISQTDGGAINVTVRPVNGDGDVTAVVAEVANS